MLRVDDWTTRVCGSLLPTGYRAAYSWREHVSNGGDLHWTTAWPLLQEKIGRQAPSNGTLMSMMPASVAAPGPKPSVLGSLVYLPGRAPIAFFANLARTYGDIVSYRMGGEQMFFVNDPQHIKDILVTHNKSFMKGRGLQRAKRILGEG